MLTRAEAIAIATFHAKKTPELHAYTGEPNFKPHDWVVDAIMEAEANEHAPAQAIARPIHEQFPHYFKSVHGLRRIDIYWVLHAWGVTDACVQHAVKKLLAAGRRGAKNIDKDIAEAIVTLRRWQELQKEEQPDLCTEQTPTKDVLNFATVIPPTVPADDRRDSSWSGKAIRELSAEGRLPLPLSDTPTIDQQKGTK